MDYTILADVRYSESFAEGTRMIQDIFSTAHRLSRDGLYGIDFPGFKGVDPARAHMTALGHQVRLFGEKDHLLRVCDRVAGLYGDKLFFPEGEILGAGDLLVVGYAQVLSTRPRKSASQAADRLRRHLERKGVVITHEITEGGSDYVPPMGPYVTYESLSNGKRFPFWVRRRKQSGDKPMPNAQQSFDRFGFSRGGWLPVYADDKPD